MGGVSIFPVITRRLKNIFNPSFVCYGCFKDVLETAFVQWVVVLRFLFFFECACSGILHYTFLYFIGVFIRTNHISMLNFNIL